LEKLSSEGPLFPDTFDLNNIKFQAFLKSGWTLDFVYELTQPATIVVTVELRGYLPQVHEFKGMHPGRHEESVPLPDVPGGLQAATYSIKAVTVEPAAPDTIPFTLISMTAGEARAASLPSLKRPTLPPAFPPALRGAAFTNAAFSPLSAPYRAGVPLGLEAITFAPRDIRLQGGRPCANAAYSFRTTLAFNGGAAADVQLTNGGRSTLVTRQSFRRRLEPGETVNGNWDCTKAGSPSVGRHVLFVRAWFTVQGGGKWSFKNSGPVVVR
jgi:hypothetical protein